LKSIANTYCLHPSTFAKQYKNNLSNFHNWDQKEHSENWILFSNNFGRRLSIDETSLSNGELYTIITNKAAKGKKGCLVAMIKGTKSSVVSDVLQKIPLQERLKVEEITLDMSNSMDWIARICFPQARQVSDRFHVQQLVSGALQEMRITLRWKAIEDENENKALGKIEYENGDTKKQLLARSRHMLFKPSSKWTVSQERRSKILFREFPQLKEGYKLSMLFRCFYEYSQTATEAGEKLRCWYEKVRIKSKRKEFRSFLTAANSIKCHQATIMNYFPKRSTNASAESFNAKVKGFRSLVRGVTDKKFFLFRISKIYG